MRTGTASSAEKNSGRVGACDLGFMQVYPHLDTQKIEEIVIQIFAISDMNGSGLIDYTEYLVSAIQKEKLVTRDKLLKAFQTFDLVVSE
jgi:Ca2+-binding EF-hand superfamily protein